MQAVRPLHRLAGGDKVHASMRAGEEHLLNCLQACFAVVPFLQVSHMGKIADASSAVTACGRIIMWHSGLARLQMFVAAALVASAACCENHVFTW